MPRVKNRLWSDRILVVGGRKVVLPPRGVAELSAQEAESPELQSQIADGSLIVLPEAPAATSGESPSRKPGRGGGGATEEAGGGQG